MEQHADVPKFGNWEGNDSIAYTAYFDNAKDGKNHGKSNNHSKHQKDPNAFPSEVPKSHASPLRNSKEPRIPKFKREQHTGRKDASYHSLSENDDATSQKSGVQHKELLKSNNHRGTSRTDGETDHNIKVVSSSNPDYQAKSTNKSGSSPSTNRKKGSPEGDRGFSSSSTAQRRSKSRPADKASHAVDKALPVPKFGDWDVNDPSSAERYTDVFNNVRKEKKASSSKIPIIKTDPVFDDSYRQGGRSNDSTACSCFSWYSK